MPFGDSAKEEAERLEKEKAEAEKKAREEEERKAKEEAERLEKEKAEAEKKAKEEGERKAKEEAERLEKEKAEAEKKAREEEERLAKEKVEAEVKAKAEEEFKREEAERLAKMEAERVQEESIVKEEVKVKKEESFSEPKVQPKKKVKVRKCLLRRVFDRLLLIIIIAALIIGGVYYLHREKKLPEQVSDEIDSLIDKFNFFKDNYKDSDDKDDEEKIDWKIEADFDADDIIDLNDKVSIVKDGKEYGLVNNETGKIVLEVKYDSIDYKTIYKKGKSESSAKKGIVIEEDGKYYSVDSKYQKADEVVVVDEKDTEYYYDHYDEVVYVGTDKFSKYVTGTEKIDSKLKLCRNLKIVTTDGKSAENDDISKETFSIDMKKSEVYDFGYFDLKTGKLVINCDYEEAEEFSDGFAAVTKEEKAGFIDEDGEDVGEFKFDKTRSVHDGLAWAEKDGKWGLIEVK